MSDDDTLGTAPAEAATVDVTPPLAVEDFDFEAFLAGARPTQRAVRIYQHAHLVADMEEAAARYDDSLPAAEKRRIRDAVVALREQFEDSARWFRVEARSAERVDMVRKRAARQHQITLPPDDATGDEALIPRADYDRLERAVMADAIVTPSGITEDGLARMAEALPTEYVKLVVAMKAANSQLAQNSGVLTRDFSPAPSGKSSTAGSRRR